MNGYALALLALFAGVVVAGVVAMLRHRPVDLDARLHDHMRVNLLERLDASEPT